MSKFEQDITITGPKYRPYSIGGVVSAVAALPVLLLIMLTVNECRKLLTNNAKQFSDEEIIEIRDFLIHMCKLVLETIKAEDDEKRNSLCKGIH